MDLTYSPKQKKIRQVVRDFAESEIRTDREEQVLTPELIKQLAGLDLWGIQVSPDFGGAGLDTVSYALAIEELSRVSASVGLAVTVHNSVGAYPVEKFGSPEQRERLLRPLARGEKIGAFCLTEPNAGSDASNIETTARKDAAGSYIINGQKAYVTNGGITGISLIFVKTDPRDKKRGMSVLITTDEMPGFSRGGLEDLCGMRGNPVCSLFFEDTPVGPENLLGREGDGFLIAMAALDAGRIGIGAQAVGIAQAALEASVRYSRERVQFGKPLAAQQMVQSYLADMATDIEAARMLVFRAASLKDAGKSFSKHAAMAKHFASRAAMDITVKAIQIHGAYGYSKAYSVERYFRDAKVTEIYEGANEVQKLVVARSVLEQGDRMDP